MAIQLARMRMRRAMWSGATIRSSPLAPAQYDVSVGAVPQRSTADQSSWIHSWQRMNWRVNLERLRFRPVLRYDDEAEPGRSSWRRSWQAFRFGLSAWSPRKRYELGAPLARRLTRKRSSSWPHSEAPASLCGVNRKRNVVVMRVPVSGVCKARARTLAVPPRTHVQTEFRGHHVPPLLSGPASFPRTPVAAACGDVLEAWRGVP